MNSSQVFTSRCGIGILSGLPVLLVMMLAAIYPVKAAYTQLPTSQSDTLTIHAEFLKEIIVTPTSAGSSNKDTISFKAADFRDASVTVLEDLLRKIPGIDVGSDGSILIRGKKVDAVLLGGDDLFSKNYGVLSKSLVAGLIDKVQVIESYNPDELLQGLMLSNKKAINIVLKNDRERNLTGNMTVGMGLRKRYDHSLNLIAYRNVLKVFYFQRYNNTGKLFYEDEEATGNRADRPVDIYKETPHGFSADRIPVNKSGLHSLSFSRKTPSRLTLKGSLSLIKDESTYNETRKYLYHLRDVEITWNQQGSYTRTPWQVSGNLTAAYRTGKSGRLKYTGSGKTAGNFSTARIVPGISSFYSTLKDKFFSSSHTMDYTRRVNKRSALRVSIYQLYSNTTQGLLLTQETEGSLPLGPVFPDSTHQVNGYRKNQAGILVDYAYTKKSGQLGIAAHVFRQNQWMYSAWRTASGTFLNSAMESQANDEKMTLAKRIVALRFAERIRHWLLSASLSGNYLEASPSRLNDPADRPRRRNAYLEPQIKLQWQKNKHAVVSRYAYEALYSDLPGMHAGYLITDYRTLEKGYGDYYFSRLHSGALEYSYSDLANRLMGWLQLGLSLIKNTSGYQFRSGQDFDLLQRVGNTDLRSMAFTAGVNWFVSPLMNSVKLNVDLRFNRFQYYQPGSAVPQNSLNTTGRLQLSVRSAFKRKFNYVAGVSFSCSRAGMAGEQRASYLMHVRQLRFIDFVAKLSDKFQAQATLEQVIFNGKLSAKNDVRFIDMLLRYEVIRHKVSVSLTGKNLGNTKTLTNAITGNYFQQTQCYVPAPAYLLLAINRRF